MRRVVGTAGTRAAVSGVLLAAGASSRFGDRPPKQIAPFRGEPLVRRVARRALASDLTGLIVVVGFAGAAVGRALAGLPVRLVENPDWAAGQGASVGAGVRALDRDCAAALFLTADQPHLDARVMNRLLAVYVETGGPIVVPVHQGRRASPVLFDRSLFGELASLGGDTGGRRLFDRHAGEIVEVAFPSAAPFADVDTPEELDRLSRELSAGSSG